MPTHEEARASFDLFAHVTSCALIGVDDLELELKALSIPRTENELVQAMRSVGLLPKPSLDDPALVEDGDLSELELEDVERRRAREQPIGFEAFQRILVHLVVERARY